ncbi:MAG: toxin-antitoxin system, antitoxin component, PHD domain protein [Kiritimatiellae bacterium]|nr:toxin-antitoxin system, antitoxin component, PHD domain protein [Kiritimatiellia bacterium]
MIQVNIGKLLHNFSAYMKEVKKGEVITVMERNTPVADITAHDENLRLPGWKRDISKIKAKKEPFSRTTVKERASGR